MLTARPTDPRSEEDLAFAGVAVQRDLIAGGDLTSERLVRCYLDRIARLDHGLRAFRTVFVDRALAEAREADRRVAAGERRPLLGVPIAVKDDVDVAGEATMWGTSVDNGPAAEDCELVRRLRLAGAVILGKTAMPELAMWSLTESSSWGITRNPWRSDLSPGGSSGGSAAAVAAGLVSAAIGSDGGGSIRMPAAACGLFAMKAQRGRVSVMPSPERWHGLLHLGPLTRSVADSALIYDAISGNVAGDATVPPALAGSFTSALLAERRPARIAVSYATPLPTRVRDEARRPVETVARVLVELGHEIVEADPPYGLGALAAFPRFSRGTTDLVRQLGQTKPLERRTRLAALAGAAIPNLALRWSRAAERRHFAPRIDRFFARHDFLLTPAMARGALAAGEWRDRGLLRSLAAMTSYASFAPQWNFTGQPAACVPAGLDAAGLPTSVQLVAPANGELELIALAAQLEAARPWANARPELAARHPAGRTGG